MKGKIQIQQRVKLAGSKLTGTTVSVSELKAGRFVERTFQVKWDTGSTGTVNESDLEIHVTRKYNTAA